MATWYGDPDEGLIGGPYVRPPNFGTMPLPPGAIESPRWGIGEREKPTWPAPRVGETVIPRPIDPGIHMPIEGGGSGGVVHRKPVPRFFPQPPTTPRNTAGESSLFTKLMNLRNRRGWGGFRIPWGTPPITPLPGGVGIGGGIGIPDYPNYPPPNGGGWL